jgi:hypothetical protein
MMNGTLSGSLDYTSGHANEEHPGNPTNRRRVCIWLRNPLNPTKHMCNESNQTAAESQKAIMKLAIENLIYSTFPCPNLWTAILQACSL